VRIDRVGKTNTPSAPAAPARAAASSSSQQSFNESAQEAALAFAAEEGASAGGQPGPKKDPLSTIDDIAARASLNIVKRKQP
jgi:hypothetical protein